MSKTIANLIPVMILPDTKTTIEKIGNVTNEAQFRMKASRKAFQILSDLYSDKPLAIVRELGCNAMDSMIAAGKGNKPFHIHLPNSLEPWLTIQDFGTGIEHEDIYGIYTVYFESTKTNSNTQVGCLGLGSKSPFCYTDSFTVTSIVNGNKRIYNAYFNDQSTPTIALMSVEKTTEGNGVAIQIPVKTSDFEDFAVAVKKSFRFFDVRPTISGGKIEWDLLNPLFKSEDWAFYDSIGGYSGNSFAIMGGVTYPIDRYQFSNMDNMDCYNLLSNGLVLKFAMGELDFTPSRESLSYCESTIEAIKNKLEKVLKEMPLKVTEIIDEKDTLLEALKATIFFQEKFFHFNFHKNDDAKITWKGIDISQPLGFFKKLAPNLKHYYKRSWHRQKITISVSPSFKNETEWFVNDLTKGSERRIRAFLKDNNGKEAMVFTQTDYASLIKAGFEESMFKMVSSLPSPAVQRKVSKSGGTYVQKAKEDITIYHVGYMHHEKWESEVIEPSDDLPRCYILKPTDGWKFSIKLEGLNTINGKTDLLSVLNTFANLSEKDFCMVSTREEKKLLNRGGCWKLEDWWKSNVKTDYNLDEMRTSNETNSYYLNHVLNDKNFKNLPDTNSIKIAILKIKELKKKYSKFESVPTYIHKGYDKAKTVDFGLTPAQNIVFKYLTGNSYDLKNYCTLAEALG